MKSRREQFRDDPAVEKAEFVFSSLSNGLIRFDWNVFCVDGLHIDAHDDLEPLCGTGADGMVVRKTYEYHATHESNGNVVRADGPDLDKIPAGSAEYFDPLTDDHHAFHHVHFYDPYDDDGERIEARNPQETPTLPEFVREMIQWHYEHGSPFG